MGASNLVTPLAIRPILWLGLFLWALIGLTAPADAFLVQTFDGRRGKVQLHWNNAGDIGFLLDSQGSADLPVATVHGLLRQSFEVWQEVETAAIAFDDQGLSSGRTPRSDDRRNVVIFDRDGSWIEAPASSGVIAVTLVQSNSATGQILDADIVFNDRDFRFVESGGRGNSVNLKDVAVHEIGHLLGLDHSPLNPSLLNGGAARLPTMNPFYSGDGPGTASSLEPDDRTGASVLYPTAVFAASSGRIEGEISDAAGRGLFGVHVIAEELESGALHSTLSGAAPVATGPGHYILPGLPAGRYRLSIEPVVAPLSEDNFGGIFSDFASGFIAEYYNNVGQSGQASPVELEAGAKVSGIDFETGLGPPLPLWDLIAVPHNTPDTDGPYRVVGQVQQAKSAVLSYRVNGGIQRQVVLDTDGSFESGIPGQPAGTRIEYRLVAANDTGGETIYPADGTWAEFEVIELSGQALVFVALRGEDALAVFDSATETEVARIPLGVEPIQLQLGPQARRLYVSMLGAAQVAEIDLATFVVSRRFSVGARPLDMALSPDGGTLYVANSGGASVNAVDLDGGGIQRWDLGLLESSPFGIAAAGEWVYATDIVEDRVLVLDLDGNVTTILAVPSEPRSLALADGRIYVSSFSSENMAVIGVSQNQVVDSYQLPLQASFAVEAAGGQIFLSAHEDGTVLHLGDGGATVERAIGVGENPRGLALGPAGEKLFVSVAAADKIVVVELASGVVVATYATGAEPRGIAVARPVAVGSAEEEGPKLETEISIDTNGLPTAFFLEQSYPNPFNATTRIVYAVPVSDEGGTVVELVVYDILGRRVRLLAQGHHAAGTYNVEWDGRDGQGRQVASGLYLVSLRGPAFTQTRKAILLR
jgi:DNA-binding beta-propeller fold protein YncE